jgi:hypothetical protein
MASGVYPGAIRLSIGRFLAYRPREAFGPVGLTLLAVPASDEARELLVLRVDEKTTLTVSHLPSGVVVVDDAGERLGEIQGDLSPLLLDIDGDVHIVFAGQAGGGSRTHTVVVELPGEQQTCKVTQGVEHGVWMTFPVPFEPGMTVTAIWRDEAGEELWRRASSPLTARLLDPVFGPEWTSYAPL